MRLIRGHAVSATLIGFGGVAMAQAQATIDDRFGRSLIGEELTLVDWEGYLANPLIEITLAPPVNAVGLVDVTLSANNGRLYFSEPSTVSAGGPGKTFTTIVEQTDTVGISIFPDRDTANELHTLSVNFRDAANTQWNYAIPIRVIDQDVAAAQPVQFATDFSRDESGYFASATVRNVFNQAIADWAYFLDDMNLNLVPIESEFSYIWAWPLGWTGSPTGYFHVNTVAYDNILIYGHGVNTTEVRSGGQPSLCCFHTSGATPVNLRRSGVVSMETRGNFNMLGWFLTSSDADWLASANLGDEPNDWYSIVHHEVGHAIAFNSGYPAFEAGENNFEISSPRLNDYYGGAVPVDPSVDHFDGVIDPASRIGAFGNEYFGDVPRRRWLITKLDLLLMEAVGYQLRETSAFRELAIAPPALPNGTVGVVYSGQLSATGGLPSYDWEVDSGSLPPGLSLDRRTGAISGSPSAAGNYVFLVSCTDYNFVLRTANAQINVNGGLLLGDMNCDGFVTVGDISGFVLALTNPAQYAIQFPACQIARADVNQDGFVTVGDIGGFVNLLTGG